MCLHDLVVCAFMILVAGRGRGPSPRTFSSPSSSTSFDGQMAAAIESASSPPLHARSTPNPPPHPHDHCTCMLESSPLGIFTSSLAHMRPCLTSILQIPNPNQVCVLMRGAWAAAKVFLSRAASGRSYRRHCRCSLVAKPAATVAAAAAPTALPTAALAPAALAPTLSTRLRPHAPAVATTVSAA